MIELSRIDKELLQLVAFEAPWAMVCGEFHGRYDSVDELVKHLFQLLKEGLVEIFNSSDPDMLANPEVLRNEALAHENFEDIETLEASAWRIAATSAGYGRIKSELDKQ